MKTKTLSFEIPEYLTLDQYKAMSSEKESKVEKMISIIASLTRYSEDEVSKWSLDSLTKVFNAYGELLDHKNEFHSIIEWNGTLYGYSHINAMTLGCYVDLELLSKDLANNMHKIAAILYRPIKKHRFDTLKFAVKQKIKTVNNQVENVFDFYELEEYDSDLRKDREEEFKSFPAHIFLGALNFFLSIGSLYLADTVFSDKDNQTMMKSQTQEIMESLLANTGAGGGLFTTSLSPIYSRLQETPV